MEEEVKSRIAGWVQRIRQIALRFWLVCEQITDTEFKLKIQNTHQDTCSIHVDKVNALNVRYLAFRSDKWVTIDTHADLEIRVVHDLYLAYQHPPLSTQYNEISSEPQSMVQSSFAALNRKLDRILEHP